MMRKAVKIVHEGKYAAEIPVELIEDSGGWSPYLSVLDAAKLGLVFELLPVSAQPAADVSPLK
jgi:hypothetical protein